MAERHTRSAAEIAQAMRPEIDELAAVGKVVRHELSRRARQQYLTVYHREARWGPGEVDVEQ